MTTFTTIFLLALAAGVAIELWLLQRHVDTVRRHRHAVPEAFRERIALPEHQKAADYALDKGTLYRVELLLQPLPLLLLTIGGGIDWIHALWQSTEPPLLAGSGLIASVFLVLGLIGLPFSIWRTFVLERKFGFNRTTPGRFLIDMLLQALLSLALGLPVILAILWLMQRAGEFWWFGAWLVWIGFSLLISWLYPTLIAPLFNRFTPLQAGPLRERIDALLERIGFASNGIFVMDGSTRSGHGNAYFSGLGRQKRIVFFDTLIETLDAAELEAVLAHELGHFKRRHVLKQLVLSGLFALVGLALLGWLAQHSWFYQGLGVTEHSNALALLLFLLVSPVFTQFLQPLLGRLSRRYEFEADSFAVAQTGTEPMINALVKLYRDNASTLTPDPLYSAYHDSHPPAPVRIAQLMTTD
ncbi:MAG: M48 family metallopeptidase [Gammaproteobacteria bacterium]|nr:M48 family metallopeptidase [Gammaproteobacteria bacterium]